MFKLFAVSIILIIFCLGVITPFGRHGYKKPPCKEYVPKMPDFGLYNLRPSERKCKEYLWKIDERAQIKKHQCTRRFFIIRGQRTRPAEYPHMGALGWISTNGSLVFLCGSSLISERFLLTAAHCTKTGRESVVNPYPHMVRLGVTNIYKSKFEIPVDVAIKKLIPHPGYRSPKRYYDIALVELTTEVTFTKFVHPACLSSSLRTPMEGKEFTITGWGAVDRSNTISSDLLYAKVDIFNSSLCTNVHTMLKNRNWDGPSDHVMCAGKLDGSADTCFGDSGGPLQYKIYASKKEGSMHTVIGVTSFGFRKCAQKNKPTIYTQVSSFIPWIEKHVWPSRRQIQTSDAIVFKD